MKIKKTIMRMIAGMAIMITMTGLSHAQLGKIYGTVEDGESKIPYQRIFLMQGETIKGQTQSNADGKYEFGNVEPGDYTVEVNYGQKPIQYKVNVSPGEFQPLTLELGIIMEDEKIYGYRLEDEKEIFSVDPMVVTHYTKSEIQKTGIRNPGDVAAISGGMTQMDQGDALNFRGGRSGGSMMIVDNMKMRGDASVPLKSIESITVISGGIPAEFGDVTSGIIVVNTGNPGMNGFIGKPMTREEKKTERLNRKIQKHKGSSKSFLDSGKPLIATI